MNKFILLTLIFPVVLVSCQSKKNMYKNTLTNAEVAVLIPSAPAVIYKTTRNFIDNVPVIMNEERTRIVSYPDPTDLSYNGKPAKPTLLLNGYLLDNRGISKNVVFLRFTYEDYMKLSSPPSMSEMMENIIEKYPLVEMYSCGYRNNYTDIVKEMNAIVGSGFQNCKRAEIIPLTIDLKL